MDNRLLKASGVAALFILGSANLAVAHDSGHGNASYQGDPDAKSICMAIVRDSVPGLRSSLRARRTYPLERVHENYECNSLPLDEFAFTVDAVETASYLDTLSDGPKGSVNIEQIGSIND